MVQRVVEKKEYLQALELIKRIVFVANRCILIVTDSENTFDYHGNIPTIAIKPDRDDFNASNPFYGYYGCKNIIVKSDKPVSTFKFIEKEIRLSLERFHLRKYLIAPGNSVMEDILDIFSTYEINYVTDIVVIEQNGFSSEITKFWYSQLESYSLWTHKYMELDNNCEKVLLDVWYSKNKSFVFDNNLYPDKLKNQMGRVLKLATMHYVPYNIIEGFTPEEYKGTESSALKLFAQEVNTTYKFLNNNNEEERWGDIYENWTGDGLLGLVVDDTVDFTFSAMGPWGQLHPYVDFSVTFERSGITCIVPAPTLAAGWLTPWYSYSNSMWSLVGASFLTCAFVHFLMALLKTKMLINSSTELANKSFGNSILVMVKIFLVQCVDDVDSPPGRYGTLFMGLLFMYSLFLSSTYSSGLAAVMTLPRYNHPIETVQDLLDSGIPWVAPHEIWIFSISHSEVPIFKAIINAFLAEPSEEKLQDFSKTRDYTFAVERLPQATFAFPIDIHDDVIENFRVLKEDLYFEQLVVIARKSSVILPVLNKYLLRFCELGLIDHWQNEAVLLFGNPHMSRAILSNAKTATVGKLKWTHVEGAFGVLIFGQLIGLLVFIFEIGEARYKREKDIHTIS
ncbi:uncharacterized protein LOC114324953 [Diabrotica virgifera virgifera]|uniref:Ionotropic glutamate receptor C-terminal domain-containing protein n=1 Tax=Diabrotica virgifera virgifera TaxID=50390 RepID=A0ABM5L0A1_DIAVI|nr:uncharacterized protein LOC114324953 [Diabrotica virgifera virgifera]